MKVWKIIVGILLFIVPIGIHATSNTVLLHAPLGTLYSDSSDTSFAIHTFNWYSDNGRISYFFNLDITPAGIWASFFFMDFVAFVPVGISTAGILTTITLYAIALYILFSIIDNDALNLIADMVMIACAVMSFIAFFEFMNDTGIIWDTDIPIFGIVAGIAGLLGFALSIKGMNQPKKRSRRK
ncbi:MAG: hypothetical protein KAJ72_03230 [Candidatus Heimdallarchaeota archaeon]|nr:hypothetical protein [Candidatus Heimdallarchaeota archaeon]